jgi:hypothetical protein
MPLFSAVLRQKLRPANRGACRPGRVKRDADRLARLGTTRYIFPFTHLPGTENPCAESCGCGESRVKEEYAYDGDSLAAS